MTHKLDIDQLKAEYHKADREGKQHSAVVNSEKEYTLNAIATIKMNACTQIKQHIKNRIGEIVVSE